MWKVLWMYKVRKSSEKYKIHGKNNRRSKTTRFAIRSWILASVLFLIHGSVAKLIKHVCYSIRAVQERIAMK